MVFQKIAFSILAIALTAGSSLSAFAAQADFESFDDDRVETIEDDAFGEDGNLSEEGFQGSKCFPWTCD